MPREICSAHLQTVEDLISNRHFVAEGRESVAAASGAKKDERE